MSLSFVLLIPSTFMTDATMGKWSYTMTNALNYVVYGVLIHIGVKIVGGRGSVRQTLNAYFYFSGLYMVVAVILGYPNLLFSVFSARGGGAHSVYLFFVAIVLLVGFPITYNRWLSRVHQIRGYRIVFANVIILPVLIPWVLYVMPIVADLAEKWFDKIMSYLF